MPDDLFINDDYKPKGPLHLFVADLLRDTIGWSDDERFKYVRLLDHMWSQGGWIPDDLGYIAEVTGINRARNWREKAEKLARMLTSHDEKLGFLTQKRLNEDMETSFILNGKRRKAQKASVEKQLANADAHAPASTSHKPHIEEKDTNVSPKNDDLFDDQPKDNPTKIMPEDLRSAMSAWNDLAKEIGLAKVQRFEVDRKQSLKAVLMILQTKPTPTNGGDPKGLIGWLDALDKIRHAPHMRGENDRGWKATFDWITIKKNITKLMEGNYRDDRTSNNPGNGPGALEAGFAAGMDFEMETVPPAAGGRGPGPDQAGDFGNGGGSDPGDGPRGRGDPDPDVETLEATRDVDGNFTAVPRGTG